MTVARTIPNTARITRKVRAVMRIFGLDLQRLRQGRSVCSCSIRLAPGWICCITGPSGSGKTVLLRALYDQTPAADRIRLEDVELDRRRTLVDCIEADVCLTLRLLAHAGLSDAFAVLSRPAALSEGQKYRYRLARALAANARFIFADEFCSSLDRITAAVIAHNVARIARQSKRTFILATSRDDLLCDLQPDVVVIKHLNGPDEVIYKHTRPTSADRLSTGHALPMSFAPKEPASPPIRIENQESTTANTKGPQP
jgi:ABC-type ATPase with predicted acetyltransferase domain